MRKFKLYMLLLLTMTTLSGCMAPEAMSDMARQECYDLDDCGKDNVCFLGGCVAAEGGGLSSVYAHIDPPNDAAYLPQEIPGVVNLNSSLEVNWTLQEAITVAGSLSSANTAVEGGRLKASYQSSIPGKEGALHQTMLDDGSFSLKLIPGSYTCTFEPDLVSNLPTITLEESTQAIWSFSTDTTLNISYPETSNLITVEGSIKAQGENETTTAIAGALVKGSGLSPGGREVQSTAIETDENGLFNIIFPAGTTDLKLYTESGTTTMLPEQVVPLTTELDLDAVEIILDLPEQHTININVSDAQGVVASDVGILIAGETAAGLFKTSATTDADGKITNLDVFAGSYKLYVMPPISYNLAAQVFDIELPNENESDLNLTLSTKIKLSGKILAHDGSPAKNASIKLKHAIGDVVRQFNTNTDTLGDYEVMIDPGSAETPLHYDLTVQFNATSDLPFYRKLMNIYHQSTPLHITLYTPSFMHGHIDAPNQEGLAESVVSIYSTEFSDANHPLLIGIALTDENGDFVLPIPSTEH